MGLNHYILALRSGTQPFTINNSSLNIKSEKCLDQVLFSVHDNSWYAGKAKNKPRYSNKCFINSKQLKVLIYIIFNSY